MTHTQALRLLSAAKDWPAFLTTAHQVQLAVQELCLGSLRDHSFEEIDESFVDTM